MAECPLIIYRVGDQAPLHLAARELARCLRAMTGASVRVRAAKRFRPDHPGIYLGLPERFSKEITPDHCAANAWDDELLVRSVGSTLLLTGSNPRSILFAAYRWLEALGARWIRPGKDGEYLPTIPVPSLANWDIREKAAHRHRGIVIEGRCFIEQVLDVVDWLPKLRMNAYMLQFRTSACFWRLWYERTDLPAIANPHLLTMEECAALDSSVVEALQTRGLTLHRVGHGWTCEAAGNHAGGWDQEEPASADVRSLLAELDGVRDWFGGVPLNTELCYSNPEARRRFVEEVIAYAEAHPEVNVLHVWASDGMNNWCECAECAKWLPSDWYVSLLNEVSPRLAEVAPKMRVVALCYSNTMWPPEQVPPSGLGQNVIFMFAPISRCYAHSILDPRCAVEPPLAPFKRNQVVQPRANGDYAAMLRAWQDYLPPGTDAFVFDYHFWRNFTNDLLSTNYVQLLRDDVRQYREAGLNGLLSCQIQRTSMPTALAQISLARYLWDASSDVPDVEEDYYPAAFGPAGDLAREFIRAFTGATGACAHGGRWWEDLTSDKIEAVRRVLSDYGPRIRQALASAEHKVWRTSLRLLHYFIRYQNHLWRALSARAKHSSCAPALLERTITFLRQTEPQVYRWVDTRYWTDAANSIRETWQRQ